MLVRKVLFILLPLIALASGQRDWRFRRPSRLPPRIIPRPVYHTIRPTTFAPKLETTTENQPHVTVTSSHRPPVPSTQIPPTRVPSYHRQPNIFWSSSSTPKPTVAVVPTTLPTTTTAKPYYVYPIKPAPKPDDIPIAHESEPLYSIPQPVSHHDIEHKVSSYPKPTTSSPKVEIAQPSTEVSSSTEAQSNKQSETTPEFKPTSAPQPVIVTTFQPSSTLRPQTEPQVKPNHTLKPEVSPVPMTSATFEVSAATEASQKPEATSASAISFEPEATSASAISSKPLATSVSAISFVPEATSTSAVSFEPEATSASAISFEPEATSASAISYEPEATSASVVSFEPEATSASAISFEPEATSASAISSKPLATSASAISFVPEATSTSAVSFKPEATSASAISFEPEATSASAISLEPEATSASVVSFEPEATSASAISFEPEATSASAISFEPEAATTEHKPTKFTFHPESETQSSEPSEVIITSELPTSELQSEYEVPSNNIKFKYIPGIGKSRNPTSATWTKPSWNPNSSKKPEHTYTGTPTPTPLFHLTTKSLPSFPKSSLKPFAERLLIESTPKHAFDKYRLMDYHCREPFGYFTVPAMCDAYVECKENRARQLNCPDGLHFNPKSVWPEYACSYPSEVKCADHDETQSAKPTAHCPRQYGYFQSHSGDCGEYIMCQEGKATEMYCPSGLAFNLATTSCDWPSNVPSCNPDVFKGFTCPVAEMGNDGKPLDVITNKQRYEKSCKKYIACQRGRPRLLSCDKGLSFDDATERCVDDEFVKNCS